MDRCPGVGHPQTGTRVIHSHDPAYGMAKEVMRGGSAREYAYDEGDG
jgi:hypothetical protein